MPLTLPDDMATLLWEYGRTITAPVHAAPYEADRTFLVATDQGGVVVKESPAGSTSSRMQAALLRHVARTAPGLPVPRVLGRLADGAIVRSTDRGEAIVTDLLPGVGLEHTALNAAVVDAITDLQVDLQTALRNADAVETHVPQDNAWSPGAVPNLAAAVDEVNETAHRDTLHAVIAEHTAVAPPALAAVPRQVVHGDFNLSNVLIDSSTVCGVIDFGDAVVAPRIWDIAVTACYLALAAGSLDHPLVKRYVQRFDDRVGLSTAELTLLPVLVRSRLALVVVQGHISAAQTPERAAYALRYVPLASAILGSISAASPHRSQL